MAVVVDGGGWSGGGGWRQAATGRRRGEEARPRMTAYFDGVRRREIGGGGDLVPGWCLVCYWKKSQCERPSVGTIYILYVRKLKLTQKKYRNGEQRKNHLFLIHHGRRRLVLCPKGAFIWVGR